MPAWLDLFLVFSRLGLLAFGGLQTVLPEIQREIVEVRHWMTPSDFLEAYALGQLAPGPNMLASFFIGYRVAGIPGALAAGFGMFLPTTIVAGVVSFFWHRISGNRWVSAIQRGLAPVALGLMFSSVLTIGRLGVHDILGLAIALTSFGLVVTRRLSPVIVIFIAAVFGFLVH